VTPRLSAVVITLNEERRIGQCLEGLSGLADEIVVLDTMSADRTMEIARSKGARVERAAFEGFGLTKERALGLATGEWVLSIDADERMTPGLAAEIRRAIAAPNAADGYWIRREVYYPGRRMRFGGLGNDWALRLFRRGRGRFTPALVHERVEVTGATARLGGVVAHHSCATFAEHLAKVERYASLRSEELAARGRLYRSSDLLRIPVEFLLRAVFRLGVLDGTAGLVYAAVSAYAKWLRYAKLLDRAPARAGARALAPAGAMTPPDAPERPGPPD
jgi:glycosyltransferase involved in cell wall biosynthesis